MDQRKSIEDLIRWASEQETLRPIPENALDMVKAMGATLGEMADRLEKANANCSKIEAETWERAAEIAGEYGVANTKAALLEMAAKVRAKIRKPY